MDAASTLVALVLHVTPALAAPDRLPVMAPGGRLHHGQDPLELSRTVTLPTPGVWYLWLKVTARGTEPLVVEYDLDGAKPRHRPRALIPIETYAKSQWISNTLMPGFRAEVHVAKPGAHVLRLKVEGEGADLVVEKMALTLAWSAVPKGDTLDHRDDPGGGRAYFPADDLEANGFREGFELPPITAVRRYHVDADAGDDGRDGLTPATAWRSLAKANARVFEPGDALLLKRGGKWLGTISPAGSGTAGAWITIGAYGDGPRPLIDGGPDSAVDLRDVSYREIRDIEVTTDPLGGGFGITVTANRPGPRPKGLRILNIVASDCGNAGIHAGGTWDANDGIDEIVIENCLAFRNRGAGIEIYGWHQGGWRDGIVRNCTAWSNGGMGGIYACSGRHILIENCRTYHNYFLGTWFWNALNVTMRRCESWRCHTSGERGGFDLDYLVNASVIEDCYSHHNEHYGFMLMGNGNQPMIDVPKVSRHNLVRRCLAEDDRPPFWIIETFEDSIVMDNIALATGKGIAAFEVSGWPDGIQDGGWPARCAFTNNVMCARDGAVPLSVDDEPTRLANVFDGTWLWQAARDKPLVQWGGTNYNPAGWGVKSPKRPWRRFTTIGAYRKGTGQDAHGGAGDPGFAGKAWQGAIGLGALETYRPKPGGPLSKSARAASPVTAEWLAARAKYLTDAPGLPDIPLAPAP
ncbi:MAG: right-handed parallel beta-helix repeat-containing protein [Candidatus Coatesbacteria bacterium]